MKTSLLHPMIVHFPIALLIVGFLFATLALFFRNSLCKKIDCDDSGKISCIEKCGFWLLILGTLSTGAAILVGLFFTTPMGGFMGELRQTHILLACLALCCAIVSSILYSIYVYGSKKLMIRNIAYVVYLAAFVLISITGHYGGLMAYPF